MRKLIIALVVASASLVPGLASSQTSASAPAAASDLQADAPSEYTVQKGDTLWAIAGKFLKEPWKWPQIWQMNREQIQNPHLIYPGDVIRLVRTGDGAMLELSAGAAAAAGNVVRLEPRARVQPLSTAIPTIPGNAIGPFLVEPLVLEPGSIEGFPRIVATEEERVIVGVGNLAYVSGLDPAGGQNWQIFRSGETLVDPVSGEVLGVEAVYIGDAKVKRFGAPSTVEITRARVEINRGDRLMPAREASFPSYVPRAPTKPINGVILTVRGAVNDIAQYSIVSINRGSRDGLEVGHVLVTMRKGAEVTRDVRPSLMGDLLGIPALEIKPNPIVPDAVVAGETRTSYEVNPNRPLVLPDERSGIVFVFRTFEKISYGMVMKSVRPIAIGDAVGTP